MYRGGGGSFTILTFIAVLLPLDVVIVILERSPLHDCFTLRLEGFHVIKSEKLWNDPFWVGKLK